MNSYFNPALAARVQEIEALTREWEGWRNDRIGQPCGWQTVTRTSADGKKCLPVPHMFANVGTNQICETLPLGKWENKGAMRNRLSHFTSLAGS